MQVPFVCSVSDNRVDRELSFHYGDLEASAQLQILIRKKLLQKNNQVQERRFLPFFKGFFSFSVL